MTLHFCYLCDLEDGGFTPVDSQTFLPFYQWTLTRGLLSKLGLRDSRGSDSSRCSRLYIQIDEKMIRVITLSLMVSLAVADPVPDFKDCGKYWH